MTPATDSAHVAADLRVVLGRLVRRLRAELSFPMNQGAVLGRLDREGRQSVSDLAAAERVRPQSMAQTVTDLEAAGLVSRSPDPNDGRRTLVDLSRAGRNRLEEDRRNRAGWLAQAMEEELSERERATLAEAVELLERLSARSD